MLLHLIVKIFSSIKFDLIGVANYKPSHLPYMVMINLFINKN